MSKWKLDNTSVVPDEVLAHRIGLVPLKTDLEHYRLPSECDCKADLGCPKCRVTLSLSVKAEDEKKTVRSTVWAVPSAAEPFRRVSCPGHPHGRIRACARH